MNHKGRKGHEEVIHINLCVLRVLRGSNRFDAIIPLHPLFYLMSVSSEEILAFRRRTPYTYALKSMALRIMNRILIAATLLLLIWTTSVAAQDITPTDPPSPTASATPLRTITLTLFRDADSLTLLVPASSLRVSLVGLEYRVTLLDAQTIIRRLDRDFASFFGLPFDQISVIGAACFRLVKSGTIGPVPIECTNGPTLFTQQLAAADGFWFDAGINLPRIVSLWQDTAFVGLCPAEQSACSLTFAVRPVVPTLVPSTTPITIWEIPPHTITPVNFLAAQNTAAPTPGYPCQATVVRTATILQVVKRTPSPTAPVTDSVKGGQEVTLYEKQGANLANTWYRITPDERILQEWIQSQYLILSASCTF